MVDHTNPANILNTQTKEKAKGFLNITGIRDNEGNVIRVTGLNSTPLLESSNNLAVQSLLANAAMSPDTVYALEATIHMVQDVSQLNKIKF